MNHVHSGRHSKSQSKRFYISKDIVELDLSTSYVSEEVWLVGIGKKRSFLFFNEGQKLMSISNMTWFNIVLFWYHAKIWYDSIMIA